MQKAEGKAHPQPRGDIGDVTARPRTRFPRQESRSLSASGRLYSQKGATVSRPWHGTLPKVSSARGRRRSRHNTPFQIGIQLSSATGWVMNPAFFGATLFPGMATGTGYNPNTNSTDFWLLAEDAGVPIRAHCPHCITLCHVAEQNLGKPLQCHKCGRTFTVQPTILSSKPASTEPIPHTAGALRLDIAGVTSVGRERNRNEDSFLVQHLTWSDLNQNHQLAMLIVADGMGGHAGGDQAARLALRTITGTRLGSFADIGSGCATPGSNAGGADAFRRCGDQGSQPRCPASGGDGSKVQRHGGDSGHCRHLERPGAGRPRRRLPRLPPARGPIEVGDARLKRW